MISQFDQTSIENCRREHTCWLRAGPLCALFKSGHKECRSQDSRAGSNTLHAKQLFYDIIAEYHGLGNLSEKRIIASQSWRLEVQGLGPEFGESFLTASPHDGKQKDIKRVASSPFIIFRIHSCG
jgi:hypothetical protein